MEIKICEISQKLQICVPNIKKKIPDPFKNLRLLFGTPIFNWAFTVSSGRRGVCAESADNLLNNLVNGILSLDLYLMV
jgi:hypothetical protein